MAKKSGNMSMKFKGQYPIGKDGMASKGKTSGNDMAALMKRDAGSFFKSNPTQEKVVSTDSKVPDTGAMTFQGAANRSAAFAEKSAYLALQKFGEGRKGKKG